MKRLKKFTSVILAVLMSVTAVTFSVDAAQQKIYGDINADGVISIVDATELQKLLVDSRELTFDESKIADVNESQKIDVADATAIQKYLTGLDGAGKTGQPYVTEEQKQQLEQMRQEVFKIVNEERTSRGLSALTYNYELEKCTDIRAEEITVVFDHTRPNGQSWSTVLKEQGVSYFTAGENIAAGYPTAEMVMQGWMNSDGHRANILSPNFHQFACGVTISNGRAYWVQLFI